MKCRVTCFLLVITATLFASFDRCHAQETTKVSPLTIGQSLKFKSTILNEDRTLNVYLPASYSQNTEQKYPTIFLLDGSMDEDFIHIVGLTQFGAFPWINMVPESIVVGISNVDRKRDFTFPTTDPEDRTDFPTAGGSSKFIQMLDAEIKPLINKRYRTDGTDTIIGQSLGGLLATEILFKHPELFDNYIIVSPSLWWDKQSLLKAKLPAFKQPTSVFIGVGKEGDVMELVAKQLSEKLESAKQKQLTASFEFFPKLDHGDTLHLAVYQAFKTIFSKHENKK